MTKLSKDNKLAGSFGAVESANNLSGIQVILTYYPYETLPCGCCSTSEHYVLNIDGKEQETPNENDPRYPYPIWFSDKIDCYEYVLEKYNIALPEVEYNDDYCSDLHEKILEEILLKNNFKISEKNA